LSRNQVLGIRKLYFGFVVYQGLFQILDILILYILFCHQLSHSDSYIFVALGCRNRNGSHNINCTEKLTFFLLVLVSLKSILEHNFLLLSEHDLHQFVLYLGLR
jgi:hypothetical protein